nr:PHP domain-containing protein [Siminovitchia fordii]
MPPHNHTSRSNFRLLDSTNSVEDLILTSAELGHKGIAITDHETVSAHVEAIQVTEKLKKEGKIPRDFKLILGNEIYLIDDLESVRDNYQPGVTKFPHFLLLAKDKIGHEQLRKLSSMAWENSFYTGTMERTPTIKKDLAAVIKESPGHIIATTACLGSESSIYLLNMKEAETTRNINQINYYKSKLNDFINWCVELFGKENFFIELQPGLSDEQRYVNEKLIPIAEFYGLKRIISTDTHYLRPEDRIVHKSFLNAKDGEREVDDFYEACFLHTTEEVYQRMDYIDREIITDALNNTLMIGEMIEDYTILHEPIIPKIDLPNFEVRHIFKPAYQQYPYIEKMANSDNDQDRYIVKLIEDGFFENLAGNALSKEKFHLILNRLNQELGELYEISLKLNQAMSSYYITVREIINIIWDDECGGNSLVGSGRGSAAGFLINYLLGITQINPLNYGVDMPHWRHIHRSRVDIADIDIDTEGSKRPQILRALRNHFGEDRVLQVCTYGTEGSKSALQTACRGLGIDSDISLYLSGMIPFERGSNWSLSDCFYGNEEKNRKPIKEFIREVEKYPNLKETALKLEGTINKRSIHAGGVIIFNNPYYKSNAMMKAPNGTPITQFNLSDSEAIGNIKFDLLTIEALDKIRATIDMLLEYGEMEWQGSLRKTFDKYLHPDNIDMNNAKLYEMLGSGEVMDLFQFSTEIGLQSAVKVKPNNLLETASANSLMRLMSDGEEQPIDTFIKFKNDISLWYKEMREHGLNDSEITIMEKHLLKLNGVADTQESVMLLSMDKEIAGFSIEWANKLRKAIAKISKEAMEECYDQFFKQGLELGTRKELLSYVWDVQIKRQLGYSFSILHTLAYSVVALQELNLNYHHNPLYWQTACLTVNAGGQETDEEESKNKSTEYGKIAYAIGNIRQRGIEVSLPDINKAGFGFTPDLHNHSIIFGLKGIVGIGDEIVKLIIENRPYNSFEDFLVRMYETKLIQRSQVFQLIKGGSFDSFGDRKEIMREFIEHEFTPKEKLTMANIRGLIELDLIPDEFALEIRFFNFRNYINNSVYKVVKKPKDKLLILDDISTQFFNEHFSEKSIVNFDNGKPIISEKLFKKEYDNKMKRLKDWINQKETLDLFNNKLIEQEYKQRASGSLSEWEMQSLSFYYNEHELANVDNNKYGIVNYLELPEEPKVVRTYMSKGIERPIYEITRIAGTVLDKNKNKNTVTVLTTNGVVTVKFYGGNYSHYDKQISETGNDGKKTVIERSWFTRGNKLLLTGFRRGNQFIPRRYRDTVYSNTVALIQDVTNKGDLILQTERVTG